MKYFRFILIITLIAIFGFYLLQDKDIKLEPKLGSLDTTSTNNKDSQIYDTNATTNYGSTDALNIRKTNTAERLRSLLHFTLPSNQGGSISKVTLNLIKQTNLTATGNVEAHSITQTAWTEAGVTWNKYDGTSNWSSAGGDFSGTVIDLVADPTNVGEILSLVLMGPGSDNPLTINWGDNLHILLKQQTETGGTDTGGIYYSKENGTSSNRPYLEITYGNNRRAIIVQ